MVPFSLVLPPRFLCCGFNLNDSMSQTPGTGDLRFTSWYFAVSLINNYCCKVFSTEFPFFFLYNFAGNYSDGRRFLFDVEGRPVCGVRIFAVYTPDGKHQIVTVD